MPEFLNAGDKVAIVAPASFIRGNIDEAVAILQGWGLEVQSGKSVSSSYHQFAGDDDLRATDLQEALNDPEIKAVFAARGGYGTVRIIDKIDFTAFIRHPKWVIGFSDITVLHSHIQQSFGIPTIHGQMPKSFADGTSASLETLRAALFGENTDFKYKQHTFPNRPGKGEGILTGGNLAILISVLGSVSDVDYDNKILFIEDVGEAYYSIDRMLWALKRAGKLDKLAGLIIGGFTSMKDSEPPFGQTVEEIVMDKVREFDYPVAFHYPAGHIDNNHALIFGKKAMLETKKTETKLTYID
ncbi:MULTISPECIES: LD-carboxypeptidase [unclassified Sphingobacterium]|uniref:S66 peptidase family protein n=1 Tax=unclassified Sphingobacterium TaxID=2609468 RepID=UPI0025F99CDA|nr:MULTISPECIES: LD-carboxypeptidase [unclassified Sphingobacterium]